MSVEIVPCDKKGREFTDADDIFVEDPKELIGQPVHFVVKINNAIGIPNKYTVSALTQVLFLFYKYSLHKNRGPYPEVHLSCPKL